MFEWKLGIIFACGPALRQFFAYGKRTNSYLPTKDRQRPNQDFEKQRLRVNARDIFWYHKAPMIDGTVFDASPIFQSKSDPPPTSDNSPGDKVKNSAMDRWENKVKGIFGAVRKQPRRTSPASSTRHLNAPTSTDVEMADNRTPPSSDISTTKSSQGDRRWRPWASKSEDSRHSTVGPFLFSQSRTGASAMESIDNDITSPLQDESSANELANSVITPGCH